MNKLPLKWAAPQGKAKVTMRPVRHCPLWHGDSSTAFKQEEQSRTVTETRVNQQPSDSQTSLWLPALRPTGRYGLQPHLEHRQPDSSEVGVAELVGALRALTSFPRICVIRERKIQHVTIVRDKLQCIFEVQKTKELYLWNHSSEVSMDWSNEIAP